MNTRISILLGSMLLCFQLAFSQETQRIVFYNMENLFDIYDDPTIRDEEFTPAAKIPWSAERFERKMKNMSEVLAATGDGTLPAIIGMCEVENRNVTEDLLSREELKEGRYRLIHYDSPDERGIDVALAYREEIFLPLGHKVHPVYFIESPNDRTRDILYVSGVFKTAISDTLHFFVNHWPSRWGGQMETEPKRMVAAQVLKNAVDSLNKSLSSPKIIIMGDLNDEPYNKSVREVLGAVPPGVQSDQKELVNLMYPGFEREEGSYYYRDWDMIDQIIVSRKLITAKEGVRVQDEEGQVFAPDWVMFRTEEGKIRPHRTKGREYYGGYSDHLPVYIDLLIE